ncbi:hypothetical protein [Terrimonas pollutisoli]|uniref:hypothetical protein n=1 Tax=Terrimonas pollutisoli TaxID=3034147 RepID=UPI0023EDCE10|nr:hypothetical protein [Terrimonas sp. H1YJ31]
MKIKLTILLLTFFVSHFSFGQIKFEDLKIDTTISGFHYAANFQGTFVYTPNGKSDLNTINPSAFSFSILPNTTMKAAIGEIENLVTMSKQNGYTLTDIVKKDTTINGYKAFILSFTETEKGTDYKNLVFDAVIMKDNTAIIFVSGDLDKGKYLENFKKTFYATKL